MNLNDKQREQLLKGINTDRVSQRKGGGGKMLSYVEAYDIKAHLDRIFGFGGWSWQIQDVARFEQQQENRWVVGYRVQGTTIGDCQYSGVAVGSSMGSQADAHDNAAKNGDQTPQAPLSTSATSSACRCTATAPLARSFR